MKKETKLENLNGFQQPNFENKLQTKDKTCKVIALAGGGAKGAFQAGAISLLANVLEPGEAEYDVVSGVSVGGINGGGIALFPKGQIKDAAEFMVNVWTNLTAADMW